MGRHHFDFEAFASSLLDAVVLADREGRITYWNAIAERVFGYSHSEILGRPLMLLMPERYREAHTSGLNQVVLTGVSRNIGRTLELTALRRNGEEFPIELSLSCWISDDELVFSGIIRDITERKRAEQRESLQYAVAKLIAESRDIVEAASRVIETIGRMMDWQTGAMWTVDDASPPVVRCRLFWRGDARPLPEFETQTRAASFGPGEGLPGRVWQSGRAVWIPVTALEPDFIRAASVDGLAPQTAIAFPIVDSHENTVGVVEFLSRDARPVDENLLQMLTSAGRQIGMLVERIEDAEVRRRDALLRSERRFRALIENSADAIHLLDAESRITFSTPGSERILGRSDLVGLEIAGLIHPDDVSEASSLLEQCVATRLPVKWTLRMQHRDGSWRWVAATISNLLADPDVEALVINFRDVTEQTMTERTLQASEERFQRFMDNVPVVAYIKDAQSRYVWVNAAFEEEFGITREDLRGQTDHAIFAPASAENNILVDRRVLAGRVPVDSSGTTVLAGGVEKAWMSVKFPVEMSSGETQIGGVAIDITERKALEKQVTRIERISGLGRIAANIAHEMNNVLMGISPFAEFIRRWSDDEKVRNAATSISRSVERGRRITSDIRSFTSATEPRLRPLDCQRWLRDLEPEIRSLTEGIALDIELPETPVWIMGDALQLHQVLMNLVVNARHAIEARPGRIVIRIQKGTAAGPWPFVPPAPLERYVCLTVQDNGCGIPAGVIERIFEPLFTTKRSGGTGLGLAITHQLVTMHGGEVHVASAEGEGTTFYLFLPIASPPAAPPVP